MNEAAVKYAQGWFVGANTKAAMAIPFELARFNGSGRIQTSGNPKEDIVGDIRLCLAALTINLALPETTLRDSDWHFHIPANDLQLTGSSNRLALAYAILFLVRAEGLIAPKEIFLSGDVTLNGQVLPIKYPQKKCEAMKQVSVTKAVFASGQEEIRKPGICYIAELRDLLKLKEMFAQEKRTVIPPDLRFFGYGALPGRDKNVQGVK